MTTQEIINFLDEKIKNNINKIVITFYEIRVKQNLSEDETDEFLKLCRTRLEDIGYRVYFTGAKYTYKGVKTEVQVNELIVALKESN